MGGSLRDQLLKAGFVDKKQARQAEVETRQQNRQVIKAKKSGLEREPTAAELAAERARQERELYAQRSRELNAAREAEREKKARRAEVKNILQAGAIPHGKGEVRYHFTYGAKVKRIYVDADQRAALAAGSLCIAAWEGAFFLVPADVGEKILERLPETFVFTAEPEPTGIDPDDPYAAFPIPDDLQW